MKTLNRILNPAESIIAVTKKLEEKKSEGMEGRRKKKEWKEGKGRRKEKNR